MAEKNTLFKGRICRISEKKNDYYLEMIQTIEPKDVFPGVVPLLDSLKEEKSRLLLLLQVKRAIPT